MANRSFEQFNYKLEKAVVKLYLKASIGSTGAVTIDAPRSQGITSITRNSAGRYTVLLTDTYNNFLGLNSSLLLASGAPAVDPSAVIVSQAVATAATRTVVIQYTAVGSNTATDPDSGAIIYLEIILKNSSV